VALESETGAAAQLLRFAVMCVREEISYTGKDGQYLRWDYRSGRRQGSKPFDKGKILNFNEEITHKLDEICADLQQSGFLPGFFNGLGEKGKIEVLWGSCLDVLPTLDIASFDGLFPRIV